MNDAIGMKLAELIKASSDLLINSENLSLHGHKFYSVRGCDLSQLTSLMTHLNVFAGPIRGATPSQIFNRIMTETE